MSQRSRRSTGSRPTVGSSRTRTSGLPSSAVASEARPLASGELADHAIALAPEPDRHDHAVDLGGRRSDDGGEVTQVLADGQVAVAGRRLRHVRDAASQRRRPGRLPEHAHRSRLDPLDADVRADQRRLAAPARAEQPRHATRGTSSDRSSRTRRPPRTTRSRSMTTGGSAALTAQVHHRPGLGLTADGPSVHGGARRARRSA